MLTILAPAKVNLTLEVLGKRSDGYHQLASVVQTVRLQDKLMFQPNQEVRLIYNIARLASSDNLVIRAANLLREETGCQKGAVIFLEKNIPLAAGLGGGSSDAAATLRGLNQLWELGISPGKLVGMASKLGSDVPFFLYGGTALLRGMGDEIMHLPSPPPHWLVLARPPLDIPDKTERMYASLSPSQFTRGQFTQKLVDVLQQHDKVISSLCYNVFEEVIPIIFPELEDYQKRFIAAGAEDAHLTGAGPTLFTLVESRAFGRRILRKMKSFGMEAYLVRTL